MLKKVTAFVTRPNEMGSLDLLLFEHPWAGVQIPAGTVEEGEALEQAALREACEETGLTDLALHAYLGSAQDPMPADLYAITAYTRVYARPDATSFDWGYLRRGIAVTAGRTAADFTQITYIEHDCWPDPQYISMQITGWVPTSVLTNTQQRHFYHIEARTWPQETRWTTYTDNHTFTLFWASLDNLPAIIPPQDRWLSFLPEHR